MSEKYCPGKTAEEIHGFIRTKGLADLVAMEYYKPGEERSPIRHTFRIKFKKPAPWLQWLKMRKPLPNLELRVLCLSDEPIKDGSGFQVWKFSALEKIQHEQFEDGEEAIAHLKKTILNLLGRKE